MPSTEEIANYVIEQKEISLSDIQTHFENVNKFDLQDILSEAEVSGMIMRRRKDNKEIWVA